MATETNAQVVDILTVGMTVALAGNRAIVSHITETAFALIGTHTLAVLTSLSAYGMAGVVEARRVALLTNAFVAVILVHTFLFLGITVVMSVLALVLHRSFEVVPADVASVRL